MITSQQLIAIVGISVLIYLIFFVIPLQPVVRNILGIVLAIVLFVILLNMLGFVL